MGVLVLVPAEFAGVEQEASDPVGAVRCARRERVMPTTIRLTPMSHETAFAPLGVLGYCLTRTAFLTPLWQGLDLPLKTVDYAPAAKLLHVVISI